MYWVIVFLIILMLNTFLYRKNKQTSIETKGISMWSLRTIIATLTILLIAYMIVPIISPTKNIKVKNDLSPVSMLTSENGQPQFVGITHRKGEDKVVYFEVEKDGTIHQRLVSEEQVTFKESSNVGIPNKEHKSKDKVKKLTAPYAETYYLEYKDTFWNKFFFMNANQLVKGKMVQAKVHLVIPDDNSRAKYELDY